MKLNDFKVLSFDCYGTLIDWETGLWAALEPLRAASGSTAGRDAALELFGTLEAEQQNETPDLLYRDLLARVHAKLAKRWGAPANDAMDKAFGASIGNWPAFPDSAEALAYLKRHYKLVILSNVDRQSFAASNKKLAVAFDAIRTAEDIGSYKPSLRNFHDLIATVRALGHDKSELLHTAQSLFHDHAPPNTSASPAAGSTAAPTKPQAPARQSPSRTGRSSTSNSRPSPRWPKRTRKRQQTPVLDQSADI